MSFNLCALILSAAAHILGWAAFLWVAFWPHAYQGVSATPVQVVDESGNPVGAVEVQPLPLPHSASFVEVNGVWALLPLFSPVVLTGLALMAMLTGKTRGVGERIGLWALSLILAAFCVLGAFSLGLLYIPAVLALLLAMFFVSFAPKPPAVREGSK